MAVRRSKTRVLVLETKAMDTASASTRASKNEMKGRNIATGKARRWTTGWTQLLKLPVLLRP